jgi:hypothetical protein
MSVLLAAGILAASSAYNVGPAVPDISMTHAIHRVSSFRIEAPYTLRVEFEDNTEQVIDFRPVLAGELFGPLNDLQLFNQVKIDLEVHILVWPNGADFEPETLHDWPKYVAALSSRAKQWSEKSA